MAITQTQFEAKGLTREEQQKRDILIAELRSRGMEGEIKRILSQDKRKRPFHTDGNGYFVKRDGKQFKPNSQEQLDFVKDRARYVALISPRGGGKSAAGAQKSMQKISQGQSGAVINPVFEDFKTSTWPEFREWVPWDHVVRGHKYKANVAWEPHQPFVLAFDNGAVVYCKGLNNPESARGPNINWLWYDEARNDDTGLAWQIAIASVRVGIDPQSFITTTPVGTFNWIHDFFIKQTDEELLKEFAILAPDRQLVSTYFIPRDSNKDNLDPAFYISLKKAYKPGTYLYRREVEGQFADEGGPLGDRSWFTDHMLDAPPLFVKKRIRYWDLAASEKKISKTKKNDPDETVGTLLSEFELEVAEGPVPLAKPTAFCIENQVGGFLEWPDIKELILKTALADGAYVPVWLEQEPAAGGKNQVAEIQLFIKEQLGPAWKVEGHVPEGDKVIRANPWFAEARDGRWWMVRGSWNEEVFRQLDSFPEVPHDDRIDSISGARAVIAPFRTWKKIVFLHLGSDFTEKENEKEEIHEQNLAV